MNYINKITKKRCSLILEDRQPLNIDTFRLNLFYNANNNIVQIDVYKQFYLVLQSGCTINNVLITSQATFDAAIKYLFSDDFAIYNTMQDAINAGLTHGMSYITPLNAGNYIAAIVYLPNNIPVTGQNNFMLNEDGTISNTENDINILVD